MPKGLLSVRPRWNLWILLGILAAALVLGVLNNLRVYEEQRVPWFGSVERVKGAIHE